MSLHDLKRKAHGFRCEFGGDGGGGSSSSTTTTTQTTDKRLVVDQGVGVSSDQSTVNVSVLDGGAINAAIDLVKAGDLTTQQAVSQVLDLTGNIFTKALTVLDKSQDLNAKTLESAGSIVGTAYEDSKGGANRDRWLVAGAVAGMTLLAIKSRK
jgi:hypothetical protein